MTDDLVQRLRRTYRKEYAPTRSMCGDNSNKPFPFPILATEVPVNPDGHEAADRIEALTAENEALKKSGRALLNAKHKEAAEAMLWFEEGQALTAENERLRKALGAAPLISAQEGLAAFKSRQDEWLRTEYRAAHHPECGDATGAYPGGCTCAAIKRREALDNLFASDADLIDVETEATQEGGWKEAGQPWLWIYDPHLKEKKP